MTERRRRRRRRRRSRFMSEYSVDKAVHTFNLGTDALRGGCV